jgi:hypothetical protein
LQFSQLGEYPVDYLDEDRSELILKNISDFFFTAKVVFFPIWITVTSDGSCNIRIGIETTAVGSKQQILNELFHKLNAALITQSFDEKNSEPEITEQVKYSGVKNLLNDGYKIFLVKKYGIEKNDALGGFICEDKLFENVEQALKYAASIDGMTLGNVDVLEKKSETILLTEVQKALYGDQTS